MEKDNVSTICIAFWAKTLIDQAARMKEAMDQKGNEYIENSGQGVKLGDFWKMADAYAAKLERVAMVVAGISLEYPNHISDQEKKHLLSMIRGAVFDDGTPKSITESLALSHEQLRGRPSFKHAARHYRLKKAEEGDFPLFTEAPEAHLGNLINATNEDELTEDLSWLRLSLMRDPAWSWKELDELIRLLQKLSDNVEAGMIKTANKAAAIDQILLTRKRATWIWSQMDC